MNSCKALLQPIDVGNMHLKNRILMSPMAGYLATHDCYCNGDTYEWVRQFASGGAATVVIGTGVINELPPFVSYLTRVWDDTCISGLNQTFETIRMFGAKAGLELVPLYPDPDPFDVREAKGKKEVEIDPNNLSIEDIRTIIKQYADAAERVMKAGGDFIVVHGAHAQLPAAFFSKALNTRHDEYGIDNFEDRSRFALEVLKEIRKRCKNQLAIEYRISCTDMVEEAPTMGDLLAFSKAIEPYIDCLHISRGQLAVHSLTPYVFPPLYFARGFNLEFARQFKKELTIPITCVGGMDAEIAAAAIEKGWIDMVSLGRPLLADPQLPNKLAANKQESIRPCLRCNNCINRTHNYFLPIRCSINPRQGRLPMLRNLSKPQAPRKVAVIGGGTSGMEAAIAAAERGHIVDIYEESFELGGTLTRAATSPLKNDIKKYLDWITYTVKSNPAITIHLNTHATGDLIKSHSYDAAIVAIGAKPIIPRNITEKEKVFWIGDVEGKPDIIGNTVALIGAGMTGLEFAVEMVKNGKKITIVDRVSASEIGAGGAKMNFLALKQILEDHNTEFIYETSFIDTCKNGVIVSNKSGEKIIPCDSTVLSLGVSCNKTDLVEFEKCAQQVIIVGDCGDGIKNIMNATTTGFDAAYSIL